MPGFFAEEFLQEVLARNDIVDVVGEYVQLRRKGANYWGLCPFHGEKTPSFSVAQDKQFYYCFGCHAGGNAFQFVQNMEKCDFAEAVEHLAQRAGMEIITQGNSDDHRAREEQRTALYEIGRAAARFYHQKLYSGEGFAALEYLQNRGLTERIIKRFGLGFAPNNNDEAIRHLEAQGFTREQMKLFAVAGEKEGRYYDYFRNRIMFPIIDRRGRIIGFGGRVMDDSQPKYLNSPETPVFNKRLNLFGMNLVQQLRSLERLVIVEGYMDVISMHQAGLPYTVASLGTALTEEQARLVKRYCTEVFIAYDGDTAGQKATLRSLEILRQAGLAVRVLQFPDNMDPDDYAKRFGLTGLEELMDKAPEALDYHLRTIAAQHNLTSEDGRHHYVVQACREVLAKLTSPVELDIYVKRVSREAGVSEMAVYEEAGLERSARKAAEYSARNSRNTNAVTDGPSQILEEEPRKRPKDNARRDAESYLIRLAMEQASYAPRIVTDLSPDDFNQERVELARLVLFEGAAGIPTTELMNRLDAGAQSELARILLLNLPPLEDYDRLYDDCIATLRDRQMTQELKRLREELQQPGLSDDTRTELKQGIKELLLQQQILRRDGIGR